MNYREVVVSRVKLGHGLVLPAEIHFPLQS